MGRSLWAVPVILAATLLIGPLCIVCGWLGRESTAFAMGRFWCRLTLWVAGARVRFEGLEHIQPDTSYIVIANHQSLLDIPVTVGLLPLSIRMIAKKELFRIPIFGPALKAAGHITIDRENLRDAVAAVARARDRMQAGGISIMIYPEGTRSPDGRVQPFKRGAFRMAHKLGAPLLPVAITGTAAILPKHGFRFHAGEVRVIIGEPIDATSIDRKELTPLIAQIQQWIAANVDKAM